MSAKDPPNLRCWVGWGVKKAGKQGYRRKFELAPKTVSGATTTNGQRKGDPDSWSSNSWIITFLSLFLFPSLPSPPFPSHPLIPSVPLPPLRMIE